MPNLSVALRLLSKSWKQEHAGRLSIWSSALQILSRFHRLALRGSPNGPEAVIPQGNVAYMQGDYPTARSLHLESLQIKRELGDKGGVAISLAGLGEVAVEAVESEQPQRGARLLGASDALYEALGAVMDSDDSDDRIPYDRAVASARSQLGEEAFEQAWQEGRAMNMEQAVEYALEES